MVMEIEYVNPKTLIIPEWKATYTLRPELLVISASLSQFGFIQPIHVRKSTNEIIDGSERIKLAMNIKDILKHTDGLVPVVFHDFDLIDAMMLHVRLNRGHSTVVASKLSSIIRKVRRSGKYGPADFDSMLCMRSEELSIMLDGSLIKVRNLKEHNYARAWVPIEAPAGYTDSDQMVIERPPNPDR